MAQQTSYAQPANYNISPATRSNGQSSAFEVDSKGNLLVNLNSNAGILSSSPINGQAQMTGSAFALPSHALLNGVILTAKSTNAAPIEIGIVGVTATVDGTGNGYILEAGASMSWAVSNTNSIFVIGTASDVLSFAGS